MSGSLELSARWYQAGRWGDWLRPVSPTIRHAGNDVATIGKIGDIGRDSKGHWRPGYVTHAELVSALESATGERRAELVKEAKTRMKYSNYPSFPERLGLGSPEQGGST